MIRTPFATLALLLIASTFAFAQPPGRCAMRKEIRNDIRMREPLKERLKLTDAQETQMRKLRVELQKKQTPLHARIRVARLDIRELFFAEKPDQKAIEKKTKEVTDLQEQLKLNMIDQWFAVNALLTPEQQKVWKNIGAMGRNTRMKAGRMGPPMGFDAREEDSPDMFDDPDDAE